MSNDTDTGYKVDAETLEKIIARLEKSNPKGLDEDDIEVLKRVISMVKGFDALGSFANFVKTTLLWLGVVIAAYVAFKQGLADFVTGLVSKV